MAVAAPVTMLVEPGPIEAVQAKAAKRVIVSCEELVPREEMRNDPDRNQIPFFIVDAVVHLPNGAHPTACNGYYDYDDEHLLFYGREADDG